MRTHVGFSRMHGLETGWVSSATAASTHRPLPCDTLFTLHRVISASCMVHGACDACTSASTPRPCHSPPEAVRTWHRATTQREMRYRTHALRHAIPAPPAAAAAPSRKPSKVVGPGMRREWHPASLKKTHECDNIGERHDTTSMNARESLEAGVGRTITETGCAN